LKRRARGLKWWVGWRASRESLGKSFSGEIWGRTSGECSTRLGVNTDGRGKKAARVPSKLRVNRRYRSRRSDLADMGRSGAAPLHDRGCLRVGAAERQS
jgi:hypothetical protein